MGVLGGGDDAGRFVHGVHGPLGLERHRRAVERDVVAGLHVTGRVDGYHAVDGDAAVPHERLRRPPRGDAGVGEVLGQSHEPATIDRVDLTLLSDSLTELGEPRYRGGQIWRWAAQGAASFSAMTDVPRSLRERLTDEVPFSTLTLEDEAHASDGTVKALFRTADGRPVEAVLMRYRDGRRSLCLSSQSGCPLTCTFCATGAMAFGRNLTASELSLIHI